VIDTDSRAHRAYRRFVDVRFDPGAVDVSEDRVRIARLDGDDFRSLRALLARSCRVERTLLAALAGAAAREESATAMALSAAAESAATRIDLQVTYWERVVDPEEHARGNDLTGLDAGQWDASIPVLERPRESTRARNVDPASEALAETYARAAVVGGLLARGLYDLTAATADGAGSSLPALPGLSAGIDHARASVDVTTDTTVGALAAAADDVDVSTLAAISDDEPSAILRAVVPSVPDAVPLAAVVEDAVRNYRTRVGELSD